jgi:hypothetical protein
MKAIATSKMIAHFPFTSQKLDRYFQQDRLSNFPDKRSQTFCFNAVKIVQGISGLKL